MARLWIDFCRPCFYGLLISFLIYWSICYYPPPPILLYLTSLASPASFDSLLRFAWNNLPLFLLLCGYLKFNACAWMIPCSTSPSPLAFQVFMHPLIVLSLYRQPALCFRRYEFLRRTLTCLDSRAGALGNIQSSAFFIL